MIKLFDDLWPFIDLLLEENVSKTAKSKIVPASACAVWYQGQVKFEQLDGKTGLKHGTSKKAQSKGGFGDLQFWIFIPNVILA